MRTSAYDRGTRFEICSIRQEANGLVLVCSPRGAAPGRTPEFEIPEGMLTQKQHDQIIAVFTFLEEKFAIVFDEWAADPARNQDLVAEAVEAKRALEATRKELEDARKELAAVNEARAKQAG